MDDYESVLLILPEVFMYKIPPRATNRSYRYKVLCVGYNSWCLLLYADIMNSV